MLQRILAVVLLYPCSLIYGMVLKIRRFSIQRYYPIYKAPTRVISIGNIAVGGTGKTPLTAYILSLARKKKQSITVISRGYGGKGNKYPIEVTPQSDPILVGDEPAMLMKLYREARCIVDPKRKRAMEYAIQEHIPSCFLLDDGMQHLYVARDCNIVILTVYDILHGWNKVLPFGRWRECASALYDATIFCVRATKNEWESNITAIEKQLHGYGKPTYAFSLKISQLYTLMHTPMDIKGVPYSIICGIGSPQSFYKSICSYMGYPPKEYFPCRDHATQKELEHAIAKTTTPIVICTEKDAVKLTMSKMDTKEVLYAKAHCIFEAMLYTKHSFDEYYDLLFNSR